MQELVLVANLQKLGDPALVIIENGVELRDFLLALLADPVVDLLVGTVAQTIGTPWLVG